MSGKMDKLREKLYCLITEKAEYNEVLKVSQELDVCITEFTFQQLNETSIQDVSLRDNNKQ